VPHQPLADVVLVLHFGIVLFVVLGLPAVVLGNRRGWTWVNNWWLRVAHLATIAVVVMQAWFGQYCSLTLLESELRERAGQAAYEGSFIQHWVQRSLYFEGPLSAFALAYTCFAALVFWALWRYPPTRSQSGRSDA
jgi:hypothetical protein